LPPEGVDTADHCASASRKRGRCLYARPIDKKEGAAKEKIVSIVPAEHDELYSTKDSMTNMRSIKSKRPEQVVTKASARHC